MSGASVQKDEAPLGLSDKLPARAPVATIETGVAVKG
jgi:hypothetical protein